MLSTTDFRRGLKIEIDGTPYEIVDFLHVKPVRVARLFVPNLEICLPVE